MHLQIEPSNLDVNVHPTKHEVHFLYESEIITKIREAFEEKLVGANETRTLYMQQLLPGASDPTKDDNECNTSQSKDGKIYAKDIVRVDTKEQKLDKFFGHRVNASQVVTSSQNNTVIDDSVRVEIDDFEESIDPIENSRSSQAVATTSTPITTFMPILPTRSTEERRK